MFIQKNIKFLLKNGEILEIKRQKEFSIIKDIEFGEKFGLLNGGNKNKKML